MDNFYKDDLYLNILDREKPYKSNEFFKSLITVPFEFNINIKKASAFEDIKYHLNKELLKRVQDQIFIINGLRICLKFVFYILI